ncbi:hypothetical protein V7S43_018543 [Phytophthora oleae]|uniref:Uncharacterized protein n=1 Tax=Phytophthora oleae TaxID=2107226 RepID=A0ABD3EQD1_9STRA
MTSNNFAHLLPLCWIKHGSSGWKTGGRHPQLRQAEEPSVGVLDGVRFFTEVFHSLSYYVEWLLNEGDEVKPRSVPNDKVSVAKVTGKCHQLAAGVATQVRRSAEQARALGWNSRVAAPTRRRRGSDW